jgi:hypothetical protein
MEHSALDMQVCTRSYALSSILFTRFVSFFHVAVLKKIRAPDFTRDIITTQYVILMLALWRNISCVAWRNLCIRGQITLHKHLCWRKLHL